jgi:hypothetical protein
MNPSSLPVSGSASGFAAVLSGPIIRVPVNIDVGRLRRADPDSLDHRGTIGRLSGRFRFAVFDSDFPDGYKLNYQGDDTVIIATRQP